MCQQVWASGAVVGLAIVSLMVSNLLHDRGAGGHLSRRLASALGGLAYLAATLWLDIQTAIAVLGSLTFLIITLRLGFRRWLRGVKGNRSSQAWAEITYPVAGTLSLIIGWGLFGDRRLAFLPVAFLAWGDNAAGLTRDTICQNGISKIWPSLVMLSVCMGVAALYQPFWIGAMGAVVATLAERYRPAVLRFWDDNLNVVTLSLSVMIVLTRL